MKKNFFIILLLLVTGSLPAQVNYFVASTGDDTNDGSLKLPFQTIEKAQMEARKVSGNVTIYIREGKYHLVKPLLFTSADGKKDRELIICSYPGERVILTGSTTLDLDWKSYKNGIMKSFIAVPVMDMLIADRTIRHMARYPNFDSTAVRFNGTSAEATSPVRIKKWKKFKGGYLHAMHVHDWGDFHYRIVGKDAEGNLKLEGGWQNNRQLGLHAENRMVENVFEELDVPGEWYYDTSERLLYYYPMDGEKLSEVEFEAPQLKSLIEFRGTEQDPVCNITLKGVELTGTVRTFMENYEPLLRSDWRIYRGGAVFFEGSENCAVMDCDLYNLGGNAVFFSNYNRNSRIIGSHITNIGASAICFVGDPKAVRSPSFEYNEYVPASELSHETGPLNNNYPSHCMVYDNLIHSIGLFEKQITGVELSMCQYITVSHNSIFDTPRAGINVSEGTWGGHIIEYNDVFETVKETGDHGSFNSWGRDRFWHPDRQVMDSLVAACPELILKDAVATVVLRNNRFRCDRGWDIDLDDGSTNYHIYNNLCLNGGIKLREGFYRIVENNILVNNTFHPHVWFKNSGDIFTRNIVMASYRPIMISHWGTQVDYNIFSDSLALKQAQNNHTDKHSIVCAPVFCAAEKGDFKIANNQISIFQCGFKNFDMDSFGVVSPRLKKLSKKPSFPQPVTTKSGESSAVINWKGVHIKNLDTLGERSATGMDSERGVYVVSVDALGCVLRDFIQANDVIIGLGNTEINDLNDLQGALQTLNGKNSETLIIYRNQNKKTIQLPSSVVKQLIQ